MLSYFCFGSRKSVIFASGIQQVGSDLKITITYMCLNGLCKKLVLVWKLFSKKAFTSGSHCLHWQDLWLYQNKLFSFCVLEGISTLRYVLNEFLLVGVLLELMIGHLSNTVILVNWEVAKFRRICQKWAGENNEIDIAKNSRVRIPCEPFPSKAFCSLLWEFPLLCLVGCSP